MAIIIKQTKAYNLIGSILKNRLIIINVQDNKTNRLVDFIAWRILDIEKDVIELFLDLSIEWLSSNHLGMLAIHLDNLDQLIVEAALNAELEIVVIVVCCIQPEQNVARLGCVILRKEVVGA